jgi:hypothetical protein
MNRVGTEHQGADDASLRTFKGPPSLVASTGGGLKGSPMMPCITTRILREIAQISDKNSSEYNCCFHEGGACNVRLSATSSCILQGSAESVPCFQKSIVRFSVAEYVKILLILRAFTKLRGIGVVDKSLKMRS